MNITHHQLVELLDRSGAAHGKYEHEVLNDVYDEEWALWYADWLIKHGFNAALGTSYDSSELGQILHALYEDQKRSGTSDSWGEYTARRLLEMVT